MFHSELQMYFNMSGKLYLLWNGSFHPKLIHLLNQSQRLHGAILCGLVNSSLILKPSVTAAFSFRGTCLSKSYETINV